MPTRRAPIKKISRQVGKKNGLWQPVETKQTACGATLTLSSPPFVSCSWVCFTEL